MKLTTLEKDLQFGHTSFIKVVINGTIEKDRNETPHEDSFQAAGKTLFLKILKTNRSIYRRNIHTYGM